MRIHRQEEDSNGNTMFLMITEGEREYPYYVHINDAKGIAFSNIKDAIQYFTSLINFNFTKYINDENKQNQSKQL